jgi:DNA modification methylase
MVKLDFNKKGIKLYNGDCFDVFKNIKDKTIDLFILDLPYGQTACEWDTCIDLKQMWIDIKRIMKPSAILCFFCTTKFGYQLIKSNEKWFKYDLIWQKSRKVGFLSANKRQLRNHENIYVFSNDNNHSKDDKEIKRNIELRKYAEKIKEYINKPLKQISKDIGNMGLNHFYAFKSSQFEMLTEKTYKKLIELYNIDKMEGFMKYEDMVKKWEKNPISTYNPQKTEGKPYKTGESDLTNSYYRDNKSEYKSKANDNKGDRHPTSIIEHENIYIFKDKQGTYNPQKKKLNKPYTDKRNRKINNCYGEQEQNFIKKHTHAHPTSIIDNETTILKYNNPHKTIHRTEKPVGLLEYLIKTYSNEGDVIMDFTMGSGSCGVACYNTKRKFIGVEMDKDIYQLTKNRIEEHLKK